MNNLLYGFIGTDITLGSVLSQLSENDSFILSSSGGDLYEGWAIHDAIKGKVKEIEAIGLVASSAIQILLAADVRTGSENSRYLIHNPWTIAGGDSNNFSKTALELEKEQNQLIKKYSEISGKDIDFIKNLMKEERVLMPDEALELKIITNIKKSTKMSDEKLNSIANSINKLLNYFKPKNEIIIDANGAEIDFGSYSMEVGASATVGGQPASGEYILPDARKLIFENGVLMQIVATSDNSELETLKNENQTLRNELTETKNLLSEKEKEFSEFKAEAIAQINAVKSDFESFKNKFSNNTPINTNSPEPEPPQNQENFKKFSWKKNK